jgi:probable phosphoglycerate mutase
MQLIGEHICIDTRNMLRILLIRPGATEFDEQGRIQGTLDIPLSTSGMRQTSEIISGVRGEPIDAIYASPCQAAQQTADALASIVGVKHKTVKELHNINHGLWQGMLVSDVKAKQPKVYRQWQEQPETVCPPQGEPLSAAKQRVAGALRKLLKKHKLTGAIAIVAPEPLATVIHNVLCQDELARLWKSGMGCGKWEAIEVDLGASSPTAEVRR